MIHKQFEKLIPYVSENFITYRLWEEGKYFPFINIWQKAETKNKCTRLSNKVKKIFENSGYMYGFEDKYHPSVIHHMFIYPDFYENEDGGYEYVKEDWSIEEMIELALKIVK